MSRTTTVHIDLTAIRENIHTLRGSLAAQRFMAVVKADAFGHGAVRVAQHSQHNTTASNSFAITCIHMCTMPEKWPSD